MNPTLMLTLLLSCADKGPVREPKPCAANWRAAPCSGEWVDLYWCDPCGHAWHCEETGEEYATSRWQEADISCDCITATGGLTDGESCDPS